MMNWDTMGKYDKLYLIRYFKILIMIKKTIERIELKTLVLLLTPLESEILTYNKLILIEHEFNMQTPE